MPARITHVALKDYRSIGSCDVELQPLTLLVGPNGSGKSNFLDALRFLRESMYVPLTQLVSDRFGLSSVLRKQPNGIRANSFSIGIRFQIRAGISGMYRISVTEGPSNQPHILEERCEIGTHWFDYRNGQIQTSAQQGLVIAGDRPMLATFGLLAQFTPVLELISGFAFYAPSPQQMRPPIPVGAGSVLTSNGSNAADVYARLSGSHFETMERLQSYLRSLNPEFAGLNHVEINNHRWLVFHAANNPSGLTMNGSQVSDGTLRAVAILLAIFQTSATRVPLSLIGLEEPESNLHPAAAGVLLDALLEASHRTPIIASTHSADLLDRKDLPESSILAFALQDGETIIGPVDAAGKEILHKRLYTAGELLRSNQLNPELPVPRT